MGSSFTFGAVGSRLGAFCVMSSRPGGAFGLVAMMASKFAVLCRPRSLAIATSKVSFSLTTFWHSRRRDEISHRVGFEGDAGAIDPGVFRRPETWQQK